MKNEIDALKPNHILGVWPLYPRGKKALGCKWAYKIKCKSDRRSIECYKACLVILGNTQIEGLDYYDTFAPVNEMITIHTLLTGVPSKHWGIHQMDVHNAFFHSDLFDEVYMKLPPRFSNGQLGQVCQLKKSLYGLKQAPRCWFTKLSEAL